MQSVNWRKIPIFVAVGQIQIHKRIRTWCRGMVWKNYPIYVAVQKKIQIQIQIQIQTQIHKRIQTLCGGERMVWKNNPIAVERNLSNICFSGTKFQHIGKLLTSKLGFICHILDLAFLENWHFCFAKFACEIGLC